MASHPAHAALRLADGASQRRARAHALLTQSFAQHLQGAAVALPASTLETLSPRAARRVPSVPSPSKLHPAQVALTALIVVGPFVGIALAVLAGVAVGWVDLALAVGLYAITVLGMTAGYHRLFTHRAFVACRPLKIALAVM